MSSSHILIIEDDKLAANFIAMRLKKSGFMVDAVSSGYEALKFLKKNKPDLIITDLLMPVMDGNEVLRAVRADNKTKNIPVIMLTAKADQADKVKALKLGVDDYITKPYDPEEFLARVRILLKRTRPDLPKKVKNILITGGAGFIGSALARRLLADKYTVTIIDNFSTGSKENIKDIIDNKNLCVITGSITDETIVAKAIEHSDLVYHLAATVGVKNVVENPLDTVIYDTIGTSIVLKYASAKGVKVIITSTSEAYGKANKYPFKEDDDAVIGPPEVNRWSYACSKLLDEFLAIAYHRERGLPVVIIRLFNVVGPGQVGRYGMVLPRFFKSAFKNQPIHVYGDGNQVRCFTYIDDAIELIIKLAQAEKSNGQVVNLGSNNEISIKELAKAIKSITKSRSRIVFEPYSKYYGKHFQDIKKRVPDLIKLKRITGLAPATGISEILKKMKHYYDTHRKELERI